MRENEKRRTTTPHHPFPFQVLFFSLPSHPTHFLPLPFPLLVLKGCLGGRKGEGREKRRRRRRGKLFFFVRRRTVLRTSFFLSSLSSLPPPPQAAIYFSIPFCRMMEEGPEERKGKKQCLARCFQEILLLSRYTPFSFFLGLRREEDREVSA